MDDKMASYPLQQEDAASIISRVRAAKMRNFLCHHSDMVMSLGYYQSKKDVIIVSGGKDKVLRIWGYSNPSKVFSCLSGHTDEIHCICVVPWLEDLGTFIISGGKDNTILIWHSPSSLSDDPDFRLHSKFLGHNGPVGAVAWFKLNGRAVLASGSHDKTIVLWDIVAGDQIQKLAKHTGKIYALAAEQRDDSSGVILVSGAGDNIILVWDLKTGNVLKQLVGHTDWIRSLSFCRLHKLNGDLLLASGSVDCTIRIWNVTSGKLVSVLRAHTARVNSLYFLHDRSDTPILLSGSHDRKTMLWNIETGQLIRTFVSDSGRTNGKIWAVIAFRSQKPGANIDDDSVVIIDGNSDGITSITNLGSSGNPTGIFQLYSGVVSALDVSSYLGCIAYILRGDNVVKLACLTKNLPILEFEGGGGKISTFKFALDAPDSGRLELQHLAIACEMNIITLWRLEISPLLAITAIKIRSLSGFTASISSVALLQTKDYILIAGGSSDTKVRVWKQIYAVPWVNSKNDSELMGTHNHKCKILAVVLHSSRSFGEIIVSSSEAPEKSVVVYSLEMKEVLCTFAGKVGHTNNVNSVVCVDYLPKDEEDSEEDTIIISGGDRTIRLWSIRQTKLLRIFDGHRGSVTAVGVHRRKKTNPLVISGSLDNTIMIWSFEGSPLLVLESPLSKFADTFAFLQDNDVDELTIFSSGAAHAIIAWDSHLKFLPTWPAIRTIYELDKKEGGWRRLNSLINNFGGEEFFSVAFGLFGLSFDDGHHTELFWGEFLPRVSRTVITANFRDYISKGYRPKNRIISLLCLAIDQSNLAYLRIVLSKWTAVLMADSLDLPVAANHLCNYIDKDEVISLSRSFPADFEDFLCGLSQLKTPRMTSGEDDKIPITATEFLLTGAGDVDPTDDIWSQFRLKKYSAAHVLGAKKRRHGSAPLTETFLPLQHTADVKMIRAYSETCHTLHSVALFENDIAIMSVEYAWRQYARNIHIFYLIFHIIFVILFSSALYLFNDLTVGDNSTANTIIVAYTLQACVLLISVNQMKKDISRLRSSRKGVFDFFLNIWNFGSVVTSITTFTGSVLRLTYGQDITSSRCILSVASIFIWLQLLYFFTVFRASGPLVAMILRMASSIQIILFIVFLVIVGFSQAFWVLSDPLGPSRFAAIDKSLLASFEFMMGGYNSSEFDTSFSPEISILLSIMYMILVAILLLNLVIAMMTSNFEEVKEHASGERYLLLADRVLDIAKDFTPSAQSTPSFNPRSIFALRLSTDYLKMKSIKKSKDNMTS